MRRRPSVPLAAAAILHPFSGMDFVSPVIYVYFRTQNRFIPHLSIKS